MEVARSLSFYRKKEYRKQLSQEKHQIKYVNKE